MHFLFSRMLPKNFRCTIYCWDQEVQDDSWEQLFVLPKTLMTYPMCLLATVQLQTLCLDTLEQTFSGETALALMLQPIICTNVIIWLKNSVIWWKCTIKPLCGLHGEIVFTYSTCLLKNINRINWEVFFVIWTKVDFSGKTDLSALHKGPEQCFNI